MAIATGHIINQRYRIVKTLTQGGFGRLYRAWDLSLKRPVALKQNLDDSQVGSDQFETEALILADLHHPNLVRVTDYFKTPDEGQFLVMDFVEGEDLQSRIDRNGPLQEEQAVVWINQVCDALVYIHSQTPPIIHRDIKPANIRITPDGIAILVDFGIAKTYSPEKITVTGARAVTPGFAPIEQYGSARTDARSDIYAVGATLYTLLTGIEPPESINLLSGDNLPKLRTINVQISPSLEKTVHTAMALQPSSRYQSVPAMQAALNVPTVQPSPSRDTWVAKIAVIFLIILILIDIAGILSGIIQTSMISSIIQGDDIAANTISRNDFIHQAVTFTQFLVWILASIVFLMWIYMTSKYLSRVSRNYKYTPIWASAGCLIPFYNLVHPYRVLKNIWYSSNTGSQITQQGVDTSNPRFVVFWWILSLTSILLFIITVILSGNQLSLYQLQTASFMFLLSYIANATAAGITIILINKIEGMLVKKENNQENIARTVQID